MILVTGGTGLVGSHLLYQLASKKEEIIATHRNSSDLFAVKKIFSYYTDDIEKLFSSIRWLEADITDIPALTKAFKNVTSVYHCAALISFETADYKKMRQINIDGTANVVNLCIDNQIQKLCFVSSIAAVGKSLLTKEITENNDWNVEDNNYGYAISKYGAEMEVWRASQEGIDVVIVNPGVILGSGFWHNGSGKLFVKAYNEFKFYTEGITGFVSVNDVVLLMIRLMKSNIKNERFILISENISFKDLLSDIADGFGKKRPSIRITKLMSELAWRIEWVFNKKPLFTKQTAMAAHNQFVFSNKKIKDALNFEFEPLRDSIIKVCEDYERGIN